jgi:TrmH family RNA methyltransferase
MELAAARPAVLKSVSSRDNPAYKAMHRLVTKSSERKASGMSVLDGAHLVGAFLESGRTPEAVMINGAGAEDPQIVELVRRSAPAPVTQLSDSLFNSLSTVESPTGIIASVLTPQPGAVPADAPLVLLLENIQDPGNVGTLLRSAAAAGAGHVLLSPQGAFAWSPKVLRAAMGAHFALNILEGADLCGFCDWYKGNVIALMGREGTSLYDLDLRGPTAFVVGNEGAGISPGVAGSARVRASIPTTRRVESLNAGIAGSVALFECMRQRGAGKGRK